MTTPLISNCDRCPTRLIREYALVSAHPLALSALTQVTPVLADPRVCLARLGADSERSVWLALLAFFLFPLRFPRLLRSPRAAWHLYTRLHRSRLRGQRDRAPPDHRAERLHQQLHPHRRTGRDARSRSGRTLDYLAPATPWARAVVRTPTRNGPRPPRRGRGHARRGGGSRIRRASPWEQAGPRPTARQARRLSHRDAPRSRRCHRSGAHGA